MTTIDSLVENWHDIILINKKYVTENIFDLKNGEKIYFTLDILQQIFCNELKKTLTNEFKTTPIIFVI